jgi:hypothetical protein
MAMIPYSKYEIDQYTKVGILVGARIENKPVILQSGFAAERITGR